MIKLRLPYRILCYTSLVTNRQARSAKTITVINLKGGVGKTHTVWLLAGVCIERRKKILAIDTDTQANLTRSLLAEGNDRPDIAALFHPATVPNPEDIIRPSKFSTVDLLPASSALAACDLSDRATWEKSDLHLNLADFIAQVSANHDYVLIDCPPRLSLVSFAALCASDYVIIPLEAADWGAQGVVEVTQAVTYVQQKYNPKLALLGYLISRFKQRRHYQQSYEQKLREHFGDAAFDTVIPDLAPYEKSVTHAIPITLHAPASREANVARQLFREVQRRIRQHSRRSTRSRRQSVLVARASAV